MVKIEELPQSKKPCYYKPKGLKSGSYTREGDRDELMTGYEIYALQSYNDHIFEEKGSFKVIFRNKLVSGQQSGQQKIIIKDSKNEVLKFCIEPKTSLEIRNMLKIKSRQYVSTNIIKPLIDAGKLDYTNKNSINSKNQKYITINK